MLMLNTLPAAKGRRNMKDKFEPFSLSFCSMKPCRQTWKRRVRTKKLNQAKIIIIIIIFWFNVIRVTKSML